METICEVFCVESIIAWLLIMEAILHYSSPSTYAIVCFSLSLLSSSSSFFSLSLSLVLYQIGIFISAPQHLLTWHIAGSVFLQVLRNTLQLAVTNLVLDVSSQSSYLSSSPSLPPFHRSFLLCSYPLPQLSPFQRSLLSVPLRLQTPSAALHRS